MSFYTKKVNSFNLSTNKKISLAIFDAY